MLFNYVGKVPKKISRSNNAYDLKKRIHVLMLDLLLSVYYSLVDHSRFFTILT